MAMDRKVDRHEIKYVISLREAELLRHRLPALLRRDPHAGPDGSYFIRSLYFDDADHTAYREKVDGVKERIKNRIRHYNFDDRVIIMEKKTKDGDLTGKDSLRLTRAEAEAFLRGDPGLSRLEGLAGELGRLRQGSTRPAVIVDYDRRAFTYPAGNVRVTIDSAVRTCPYQTELFNDRLLTLPVLDENEAVLEVKFDAFLPAPVRELLHGVPKQRCAVSKFARCMSIIE